MSFLLQRTVGRGLSLSEIRGSILRIGRGTSADLRSENPALAFDHAVIDQTDVGYVITDSGSITGTYVNGKPVETHRLQKGDLVAIGDLQITVQSSDPGAPLFLRISSSEGRILGQVDEQSEPVAPIALGGSVQAKRFDFAGSYRLYRPFFSKLTVAALLMLGAIVVIGEVTQIEQQKAFMPGGVSSAHSLAKDDSGNSIAERCSACHAPWKGVQDKRCSKCHGEATHLENVAEKLECESCHHEHRGVVRLAEIADERCVSCHRALGDHMKSRNEAAIVAYGQVTAFGSEHPQFTWPPDENTLRFNHAVHLSSKGVRDATGLPRKLECVSCHRLVGWRGGFEPKGISFAEDCQSCHRLTFDPRFPEAEAPHGGDPGLVYAFILSTYAGARDLTGRSPDELRRILATRPPSPPDERAILNAEQLIKTRCALCHQVVRRGGKLTATKPVLRDQWLDSGKFTHGPHRNVACESCHESRASKLTSDVLMPSKKSCTECHGASSTNAAVSTRRESSRCILCHQYHQNREMMMRRRVDS